MQNLNSNLENRVRIAIVDIIREGNSYIELFENQATLHLITEPPQFGRDLDIGIKIYIPDLMITELQLLGSDTDGAGGGISAIEYYHKRFPNLPIVCCSHLINDSKEGLKRRKRVLRFGAVDAFAKVPLPESQDFLKYVRRASDIGQIKYVPPVLKGFGEEYTGGVVAFSPQDTWGDMYQGAFVVCAVGDAIRVYALVRGSSHLDVHGKLKAEGKILGGGSIGYHPERNQGGISGSSYHFGSLPNKVLENYFKCFGYNIRGNMVEEAIKPETRQWFQNHSIKI